MYVLYIFNTSSTLWANVDAFASYASIYMYYGLPSNDFVYNLAV